MEPQPESKNLDVWKLNVWVYGLSDASRLWYLKVKEELLSLGITCCHYDPGLIYSHFKDECYGLITIHVDHFYWGVSKLFDGKVIKTF